MSSENPLTLFGISLQNGLKRLSLPQEFRTASSHCLYTASGKAALRFFWNCLYEELAAIGRYGRSRDETGIVAGEEDRDTGDFLRLAEAPNRHLRDDALVQHFLRHRQQIGRAHV